MQLTNCLNQIWIYKSCIYHSIKILLICLHAYDFFTCGISYFHVELLETQHDTSCPCSLVATARKWNSHFIFTNSNHSLRITNKKTMQLKKIVLLKNAKKAYIIEENNEVYIYKKCVNRYSISLLCRKRICKKRLKLYPINGFFGGKFDFFWLSVTQIMVNITLIILFFEISEIQSRLFVLQIIFLMTFKPFLKELLEMEEAANWRATRQTY